MSSPRAPRTQAHTHACIHLRRYTHPRYEPRMQAPHKRTSMDMASASPLPSLPSATVRCRASSCARASASSVARALSSARARAAAPSAAATACGGVVQCSR